MIISASYKTDIPTFYAEWFMNRLGAGYCKMVNPYSRKTIHVSLKKEDVDGFVFWTKDISPFLHYLPLIKRRGYPFVVQYTINGYPKALEYSVVEHARSIDHFKKICDEYGNRVGVWRYDTIIISSLTPLTFHIQNFGRIAEALSGYADEVVISFAYFYRKTLRNMKRAEREFSFKWYDPEVDEKRSITSQLAHIAQMYNIQLSVCSQRDYLVDGAADARCVDAKRLEDIAGHPIVAELRGNRKECGCFASRDIGDYDTCPHGCVYCYAVKNRELAQRRFEHHDPKSEYLFPHSHVIEEKTEKREGMQLDLFDLENRS